MTRSPSTQWAPKFRATSAAVIFSLLSQSLPAFAEDAKDKRSEEPASEVFEVAKPDTAFAVDVIDAPNTSTLEIEDSGKDTIEFDAERAYSGSVFMEEYPKIAAAIFQLAPLQIKWMKKLEATRGSKALKSLLSKNHITLTVFKFGDGTIAYGDELSDNAKVEAFAKDHGGLAFRIEPTMIEVEPGRKEPILKMIDHAMTKMAFLIYDPKKVPLDTKHLADYARRQGVLGGKSDGIRGRDVMHVPIDHSALESLAEESTAGAGPYRDTPVGDGVGPDSLISGKTTLIPKHSLSLLDKARAYYQPTLWPESAIEAVFSTALQLATVYASGSLVKVLLPNHPTSHLLAYFTIVFGMGVGLQNGTYRNWTNAGLTMIERVLRRSALGFTFAVSFSVASKGGVSHLSFIDTAGVLNWAMLIGNVMLSKVGSDPITDFNRIRNEMRKNTKMLSWVPMDEFKNAADAEPFQFKVGKKTINIPWIKTTDEKILFGTPGIKNAWHSRMKWQAFEGSMVMMFSSFSKLFDQIMMVVAAGGGATGHLTLAQSAGLFLLGKSFLLAQIPIGRWTVVRCAEKWGHEDAPKMRADFERVFGRKAWGERFARLWRKLNLWAAEWRTNPDAVAKRGAKAAAEAAQTVYTDTADYCRIILGGKRAAR